MTQSTQQQIAPLSKCVHEVLRDYFCHLDGHQITDLYALVLKEVEIPLLKSVLVHTNHNQTSAATILGLSRGTLRKKIKQYEL